MNVLNQDDFDTLCERLAANDQESAALGLTLTQGVSSSFFCINDSQARQLATSLASNTMVCEIYLNIINLSVRGAEYLTRYLMNSSALEIVSLQGDFRKTRRNEDRDEAMVADVLIRAAALNPAKVSLDLNSCKVAQSTWIACLDSKSLLETIYLTQPCQLVVDMEDPILEEQSFSKTLGMLHVKQAPHNALEDSYNEHGLTEWLLRCCIHLPNLFMLGLVDVFEVPLHLRESRSIHTLQYLRSTQHLAFPESYASLITYLKSVDSLQYTYLNLPHISDEQTKELEQTYQINKSMIQVFQLNPISDELEKYCARNLDFLKHWEDMSSEIPILLWPIAATIAVQSKRGRNALYRRIPQLLKTLELMKRVVGCQERVLVCHQKPNKMQSRG